MSQSLFYYLNNLAGKSTCFDSIVIFIAQYLAYWLAAAFFALVILEKDKKKKFKMLIFSVLSIFLSRIVITEIIRFFYYVPRPFVNNDVFQLIFHETSGSFPSGHAAFFFALATVIMFATRWRTWGAVFFAGAILIGLARIIAGIHWPLDILGGAVIGVISSVFVAKFFKKF